MPPRLFLWVTVAARVFKAQLAEIGGQSHRELSEPIARWLGMGPAEREGIGNALDALQVAFDLADNLADAEEDARQGKQRCPAYAEIPEPVRYCLPAYLVATAHAELERVFGGRPNALRRAHQRVHDVLGSMVVGQGTDDPSEKARLVSGRQALLLCLPVWLAEPDPPGARVTERLEAWAEAWGTSWELGFAFRDQQTQARRRAWTQSLHAARAVWPSFGPFLPGQPLAPDAQLPGLC